MATATQILSHIQLIDRVSAQGRARIGKRKESLARAEARGDAKQAWADKVMIGREERSLSMLAEDRTSLLHTGRLARI